MPRVDDEASDANPGETMSSRVEGVLLDALRRTLTVAGFFASRGWREMDEQVANVRAVVVAAGNGEHADSIVAMMRVAPDAAAILTSPKPFHWYDTKGVAPTLAAAVRAGNAHLTASSALPHYLDMVADAPARQGVSARFLHWANELPEMLQSNGNPIHWARETVAEHSNPERWASQWGWSRGDVDAAKVAWRAKSPEEGVMATDGGDARTVASET